MTRRPNTRPTLIYWLIDTRPETIAAGWHLGKPFYCGKTVWPMEFRLRNHRLTAKNFPSRPLSANLNACGEYVRVQIMETVPATGAWWERERHWIALLRHSFGAVNVSDGGDGPAGLIQSASARAKMSAAKMGRPMHPNTRAALLKANTGRQKTESELERIGAAHRGKVMSDETRGKLRAAQTGKIMPKRAKAQQHA